MNRERLVDQPPNPNLPPYKAVTEKILGICEAPSPNLVQWNDNFERLPHTPLHSPPFWWNITPKSGAPWQCWSLEDFNSKNCKWDGCYKQCICQQGEDETVAPKCRFPNFCGYHTKQPVTKNNTNNVNEKGFRPKERISGKSNVCCFDRIRNNDFTASDDKKMPDPRCIGQYHQPLLENVIGRGTVLAIGRTPREINVEKECLIRGYVPGDVHGWRGWSGRIQGDPMYEEFNNSILLKDDSPCGKKLTQVAETWDGRNRDKDEISRQPPYECFYHDPRVKYGIRQKN